jgi:hypothetical protein
VRGEAHLFIREGLWILDRRRHGVRVGGRGGCGFIFLRAAGVVKVDVLVMHDKVGGGHEGGEERQFRFSTRAAEGRADSREAESQRDADLRTNFFLHFILFTSRD